MTYEAAIALHLRNLKRQPVDAKELREARRVIAETRRMPQTTPADDNQPMKADQQ